MAVSATNGGELLVLRRTAQGLWVAEDRSVRRRASSPACCGAIHAECAYVIGAATDRDEFLVVRRHRLAIVAVSPAHDRSIGSKVRRYVSARLKWQ